MKTFPNSNIIDLSDYMFYHNSLDEFIWLIKLAYSPADIIKRRKYSINVLFQHYIINTINFRKATKEISSPKANNPAKFVYYLKQGWYNELAASYPNNRLQDDIGTNILLTEDVASWQAELFPSWAITKTYYSIYAYYNSLLFTNTKDCNTYRHRNPTNHFNNVLLSKFSKIILKYPFNIIATDEEHPLEKFRSFERKEWKYKYASYPRELDYDKKHIAMKTNLDTASPEEIKKVVKIIKESYISPPPTFYDVENQYYRNLHRVRATLKCKSPVNIIDLMYLFRTWANYTGSDTYIDLQKGGYLRYLQKNLYTLNYFIAGLSEIVAIAFLGEDQFVEVFNEFYNSFIITREELLSKWYFIPIINRIRIYRHLNLLSSFTVEHTQPQIDTLILI
jgi:hypothetical protein